MGQLRSFINSHQFQTAIAARNGTGVDQSGIAQQQAQQQQTLIQPQQPAQTTSTAGQPSVFNALRGLAASGQFYSGANGSIK